MVDTLNSIGNASENEIMKESRIGLDGKWDLEIGLWFESSLTKLDANIYSLPRMQDSWNLGADYTFGIGSGLGMTLEYFRVHSGDQILINGKTIHLIGCLFTYPFSILDNVSTMVFYLPDQNLLYNYLSWSRTYDNWSFYTIVYWNPDNSQLITLQSQGKNLFAGKGIQLMVNYNF